MTDTLHKLPLNFTPGNQPQGLSKSVGFSLDNAVGFYISEESRKSLLDLGLTGPEVDDIVETVEWKFVITSLSENHSEGKVLLNPLADTFAAFATGAMPITISANGFLYTGVYEDHRMDFIDLYRRRFRGAFLQRRKLVLIMTVKDTLFRIRIRSLILSTKSNLQDWTQMGMEGVGFAYKIYDMAGASAQPVEAINPTIYV